MIHPVAGSPVCCESEADRLHESPPARTYHRESIARLLEADTWTTSGHKFDVISCLNLLDRCDRPLSLLQDLRAALKPGGKVLVALVLPFNPYVEIGEFLLPEAVKYPPPSPLGWEGHRPSEWLPIQGDNFEQQVTSVMADVFEPAGFAVERWARVPYLCEGDLNQAFYWLDDAVFVLSAGDQEGNS
uniref:Methyltransferase-like protein 9 n=1 Tax=Timema shepardi TaxID=629360 RepID=A0A7R9AQC9_TIMSH|nr:unnamed protein product [Timema shepardi]